MFGNLIYFNKKKVDQYTTLIRGKNIQREKKEDGDAEDKNAVCLLECSEFEKLLQGREDYIDFVGEDAGISVKDVRISSIIRVKGEIYVPQQFDMVQLIDEYKTYIISELDYKDKEEKRIIEQVFEKSKIRIPVFCELGSECDYWLGIGKASPENLMIAYNELEDFEGEEVTIIAKLETRKYFKQKPLSVFNIYKDFLGLNRALRKEIADDKDETFENIHVEEDYLGLELLAIY